MKNVIVVIVLLSLLAATKQYQFISKFNIQYILHPQKQT